MSKTIVTAFEKQTQLTPNRIAVVFENKQFTYDELNKKANALAHCLRDKYSVERGDIVPLLLDRNEQMIVAILAVLKAGACYTALSKQYPKTRIAFVKDQTKAKLIIDNNFLSQKFNTVDDNLGIAINEEDLAYIVYTSGTTGRPKGVIHTHHSIINHIISYWKFLNLDKDTHYNMLFLVNYVFSVATTQIYEALLHGHTMVISAPDSLENIESFTHYINTKAINYFQCTPSLADSLDYSKISKLKVVAVAGEKIPESLFYKTHKNNVKLINVYGQSEFHAGTAKVINSAIDIHKIGGSLDGMTAYVLNDNLAEVNVGAIGEICFTGEQLSPGYLNLVKESQQHFVPNPLSEEGTLCRTGDLVKKLANNEFEFVGRKDFQLNINGIRTEPGEIEAQLKQVPEIDNAVVVGYKNQSIVAYYVSKRQLPDNYIRKQIAKSLPQYMQPSIFIWLKHLPLNDNGKLDRANLPKINRENSIYVGPKSTIEQIVVTSVESTLEIEKVSMLDNFFKLGGNSLSAIQLSNLIFKKTHKRISSKDVFDNQTIKDLSLLLKSLKNQNEYEIKSATKNISYPMSPAQKRMFIFYEMDKSNTIYNEQTVTDFSNRLDVVRLKLALEKMTERHESLRTRFFNRKGEYVQQVMNENSLDFQAVADTIDYAALVAPFSLEDGHAMRVRVIHHEKYDSLFIDKHHLITDGMSELVFYQELDQLYRGLQLELPKLHYKDYSEWFNQLDCSKEKMWWQKYLSNYQSLELPYDHKKMSGQRVIGKTLQSPFAAKLTQQIRLFAQENQVSEYMVLFSSISILLSKMFHSEDFVLGTVANGRVHKDVLTMLGMFVNTLPVRVQPDAKLSIIDFLKQIKGNLLAVQDNQNYQFENIVRDLDASNAEGNPLFNCMFVYQNLPNNANLFNGQAKKNSYQTDAAKFALTFEIEDDGAASMQLRLNYDSMLFKTSTIKNFAKRLMYIIENTINNPTKLISEISLLPAKEQTALLTFPECHEHDNVVTLFERQVRLRPNDIALRFEDIVFTYSELNDEVNYVANYLINEKKIQSEQKIPLLLKRSHKVVIAILAVLKAGGAYVPISLKYPDERIQFIIDACNAQFVIDDEFMDQKFPDNRDNLGKTIYADQLAYLIFTSGTSGTPKGVMVEHRNLSNYVIEVAGMKKSGMKPEMVNGAFFEYVFDSSIHDLIRPFILGESVVILDTDLIYDIDLFVQTLQRYKVNAIGMTPSLAERVDLTQVPSLQVLHCGGEPITQAVIDQYKESKIQLNNCYGPTEATVLSFVNNNVTNLSIGKPIGGVHVYVLDDNLTLLPIGAIGNLFIGGNQVTRGYFNRPEETAKHYITNPFGKGIIYDTGDLVRSMGDGTYQYFGRKDSQVKIRGFRVELGEIESKLKLINGVKQVAVIAKNNNLIAYYTGESEISTDGLYDQLQDTLPNYMIPSFYMKLSKLPLTINGKLDVRALPEPVYKENYVAPTTQREKEIANSFCKVLNIKKASTDANFFRLGGNSIAAISLASAINVPVKDIFKNKTIAMLAKVTEHRQHIEKQEFSGVDDQVLSYAQQRLFFINELEQGTGAYNIPIQITLSDSIDNKKLEEAIQQIVQRHEILRTRIVGTHQEVLDKPVEITHDPIDKDKFFAYSFDLRNKLPIRINNCAGVLSINIHHIAFDGWSTSIFLREIIRLYHGEKLQPVKIQYKEFAKWQVTTRDERYLKVQEKYWVNKFKNYESLNFPTDFKRPQHFDYSGQEFDYQLNEGLMQRLQTVAQENNTSVFCVTLSAFILLLSAYSNQKDIVVGTPIANRHIKGTENMIGCFVNTLALRSKIDTNENFVDFLSTNNEQVSEAQQHQDLPFERLVSALNDKKDLSRNPIFQIMFGFQELDAEIEQSSLFSSINNNLQLKSTKFDISVMHHENTVNFQFATKLFKQQTVRAIAKTYELILQQIAADPKIKLSKIILNEQLPEMVTVDFPQGTLHELFEEQANSHPKARAIVFKNKIMTYAELNRAANRFAHTLIDQHGIKQGMKIPILMKRSEQYIIALLGILKAGACYVPLSVDYPQERIDYIEEKIKAPLVIKDGFKLNSHDESNPAIKLPKNALAYIIFTSGTTGQPKGVMLEHRSVLNTINNQINLFNVDNSTRLLHFADFVFDASVFELFTALLAGSTTFLLDEPERKDYQLLKQVIKKNSIQFAVLPPAILNAEDLLPLDTLFVAGESTPETIYEAYEKNGTKIVNAYGPTEVSICATEKNYQRGMDATNIGKALSNVIVYVLDADNRQVPVNGIGELCVGGAGLARGYFNDEQKTAKSFINHPKFGRLYKTGDLVKLLPTGEVLYIGRNDFQVKLRGFRIELGEIEAKLMMQKTITQCLALVKNGNIVAYYKGELQHSLDDVLPPYMLPSSYVKLDEFPITINGKIDLRKLPVPIIKRTNFIAPNTIREKEIAQAFCELLHLDSVSTMDDFYSLGGNSILALKLANKINVQVKQIFEAKDIQKLAKLRPRTIRVTKESFVAVSDQVLSFAQERLWFVEQFEQGSSVYNVPLVLRLESNVSVKQIEQALQKIVQRHEVLRTQIKENYQIVTSNTLKITHDPINVDSYINQVFDLENGMPIRVNIYSRKLTIVVHHIAFDGWSTEILLRELVQLYHGDKLAPLDVQYKDFSRWQRDYLTENLLTDEMDYWIKNLSAYEKLNLPTDCERPKHFTYRGAEVHATFDENIQKSLEDFAQRYQTSIYTVMLSILNIVLAKFSGQADIIVGTPFANRHIEGTENLIGFFINTLPIRSRVDEKQSFADLVRQNHKIVLNAQNNQDIPFEKIVSEIGVDQDSSRNPVFQVLFSVQDFSSEAIEHDKVFTSINEGLVDHSAKYDLNILFEGGRLSFNYCVDLFKEATVQSMLRTYIAVLKDILKDDKESINNVAIATNFAAGKVVKFPNKTVVDLFNDQVIRTPDNIAIEYQDTTLTYREFDKKTNQFANYLSANGIRPGDKIPLILERSEKMSIAIWGVLKAGCAYVPISPEFPQEREQYIFEQIQAKVVIDDSFTDWSKMSTQSPNVKPAMHDLAYIIFTSGTTGKPKGVMVEHAGLSNRIQWMNAKYSISEKDKIYQKTNYVFDVSVWEQVWALLVGASIVFAKEGGHKDPIYLAKEIHHKHITVMHFVPSMLDAFLDTLEMYKNAHDSSKLDVVGLKYVFCSGEALKINSVKKFKRLLPNVQLYNLYGPTEASIDVTYFDCNDPALKKVLIGQPAANTQCYVLNSSNQLLPVGAVGELALGGVQLARGYINQPQLTAANFIDHPALGRIYKTGDLVRLLGTGEIEYLGRNDFQVKIRGLRIELGEVEARLAELQEIKQVVVLAIKGRLVAYYIGKQLTEDFLQQALKATLPDYMIPSAFVYMKKFPFTINGKLDRRALPLPTARTETFTAPENELETKLQAIIAEVLGLKPDEVSVLVSFFHLGGDSIKAIQLSNRIKQQLNQTITIKQIFDLKTVRDMAKYVGKTKDIEIINEQGELTGKVELLPIQKWFFEEYNTSYFNQAFAISLPKDIDLNRLRQALIDLVNYHDALRISFVGKKQYYTAKVTKVALLVADTPEEFNAIQSSFSLDKQLYRFVLKPSENVLAILCHHLVIDSVSWQIISADLRDLYVGHALPAKNTSYRQWSMAIQKLKHTSKAKLISKKIQVLDQIVSNTTATITLSQIDTKKLRSQINQVYNTQINDVLLTALARAFKAIYKQELGAVKLESHGRAELARNLNVQRTVGWFTAIYPQAVSTNLIDTKHYTNQIKDYGVGYDAKFGIHSKELPRIMFNYLGQLDKGNREDWSIVESNLGQSTDTISNDFLTVNGGVLQNKLSFKISGNLKKTKEIARQYRFELERLVSDLSNCPRTYLTSDDIHSVETQAQLDTLQEQEELEDVLPANSLQEGFIYQALNNDTNDDAYICSSIFDYKQPIDVDNYRQAWVLVQQQYPSLRLKLNSDYGELIQVIPKIGKLDFELLERVQVNDIVEAQRAIPFKLSDGSLFRVRLIKRSDSSYTCVLTYHHAISDGWSNPVMLNSVHKAYAKLNSGEQVQIHEDNAYLKSQRYLAQTKNDASDYWEHNLNEVSHPDLAGLFRSERSTIKLEEESRIEEPQDKVYAIKDNAYKQLINFAKENGVTMNIIAQYAWHKLLSVYGGVKETTVGVVNAGRSIPIEGVEESVGLYIRTLPVQFAHSNKPILEQLRQLQDINNDCMMHNNVSLANLQSERTRLFDTVFIYENYPIAIKTENKDELQVSNFRGKEKLDYPLSVVLYEKDQSLNFQMKYAGEIFAESTIDQLFAFISRIIGQIVQRKSKLTYVNTAPDFGTNRYPKTTIVEKFEKQVKLHPDNIALLFDALSYRFTELNAQANRVAHTLMEQFNVKPGDRVPLLLPKTDKTILAILAILKAGAVYVPMATTYPAERIEYIKQQVDAKFVIDENFMDQKFLTNDKNPNVVIQPNDLAYIIFTSGTTGRPKGVMVEHRNFVIYLQNIFEAIKRTGTEDIEFGCIAEYVFDIFGTEIFGQLLRGKPINLFAGAPEAFPEFMQTHCVTTLQSTPGRISYFFQDNDDAILSSELTTIMVGGEKMNEAFARRFRNINLINIYGPTEGTVWTSMKKVADNYSNIGQPFPHYAHYVLDENKRLLPTGAIGELYISGPQLTRGYYGQTELTKRVYTVNPNNTTGLKEYSRLYKTGDVVRALPNGEFELIGRNDFQVKIRGFRIELGEIESAMLKVAGVKQVLALALGEEGNKYLGVYYVSDQEIPRMQIEQVISQYLTDYMMPAGYQHVEKFPLTINGKIDRRALPTITYKNDVTYVAPRNNIEHQVLQIICDLLELDQHKISVLENFFKIGGDSIRVIKLMSILKEVFHKKITIKEVFDAKTIAAIAQIIQDTQIHDEVNHLVVTKQYFNSYKKQKLSFTQKNSIKISTNSYSNVKMAFRIRDNVNQVRLEQATIQVVARQEVLRTKLYADYQVVDEHSLSVTHNKIDRTSYFAHIFNLANEIPIKVNIFDGEFTCLIDHAAFDGWSTSLFLNEIENYYYGRAVPVLPYQYKDFAKCQYDFLESNAKNQQLDFWREELKEFENLRLPTDTFPKINRSIGGDVYLELEDNFYELLTHTVKEQGMTLHNVLLCAYYLLLAQICHQQNISIAIPTVNRSITGTENLIGLFINQFLIKMKVDGDQSFRQFVKQLNAKIIAAQNNQDIPLPRILDELDVDLSGNKVYFGIQGFKGEALEHSELFLPIQEMNEHTAKDAFSDLTIFVWGQAIDFNYDKSLFKENTVKDFASRYKVILKRVVENLNTKIKSLI